MPHCKEEAGGCGTLGQRAEGPANATANHQHLRSSSVSAWVMYQWRETNQPPKPQGVSAYGHSEAGTGCPMYHRSGKLGVKNTLYWAVYIKNYFSPMFKKQKKIQKYFLKGQQITFKSASVQSLCMSRLAVWL